MVLFFYVLWNFSYLYLNFYTESLEYAILAYIKNMGTKENSHIVIIIIIIIIDIKEYCVLITCWNGFWHKYRKHKLK